MRPSKWHRTRITASTPKAMVQKMPVLECRVLHVLAAVIVSFPQDELAKFKIAKQNRQGIEKISAILPGLNKQLFQLQENEYMTLSLPYIVIELAIILQDYINNPTGNCAKQINDYLLWARPLQSISQHYEKQNGRPFFLNIILLNLFALVYNLTQQEEQLTAAIVEPLIIRASNFLGEAVKPFEQFEQDARQKLCQSFVDLLQFTHNNPRSEFTVSVLRLEGELIERLQKAKQQGEEAGENESQHQTSYSM